MPTARLPEHGPNCDLEPVDRAWYPQARTRGHQRTEHRVGAEDVIDSARISVEVEQTTQPGNHPTEVAQVGDAEAGDQMCRSRSKRDDPRTV